MRLIVVDHHTGGTEDVFEGDEAELRAVLLHRYPHAARALGAHAALPDLVRALDRGQAHSAYLDDGTLVLHDLAKAEDWVHRVVFAFVGRDAQLEAAVAAARFLRGAAEPPGYVLRSAYIHEDGDPARTALRCFGLPVTPEMVRTLEGVVALQDRPLLKAEPAPAPADVRAATTTGDAAAAAVRRAYAADQVEQVQLGGKHSAGSLLAYDPEHHQRWFLKPGAGPQNPAAGEAEVVASQAKREAAFYEVAAAWGLAGVVPEAHLLLLDGREYAALRFLGRDYQDLNELRHQDPAHAPRLFHLFLGDGTLHRWAALYFVLGEADGNSGNVMARGGDVMLIDHGSSWAGSAFAPATDGSTFVPFFLRALAPGDLMARPPAERLKVLPRLHTAAAAALGAWLQALSPATVASAAARYGIDPAPALARLARLQHDATDMPADLAVNAAWVLP